MNLKLRFKNPATCITLLTTVITFIYQILGIFGIVPAVSQDMWIQLAGLVVNILAALGILVDPTTSGVKDSIQAQEYDAPRKVKYLDEAEMEAVYGLKVKDITKDEDTAQASDVAQVEEGDK